MQINYKLFLKIFFFILIFNSSSFSKNNYNIIISENEFLDKEVILSLLEDNVINNDKDVINLISKKLFSTGKFKDISVEIIDNDLFINLVLNPVIRKINFFNNERFKKDDLLEIYDEIIENKIYDKKNINKYIYELTSLYKSFGYNQIDINHKIKPIKDIKAEIVDVDFFIDEGKISKISKVNFQGNLSFSNSNLTNIIVSKPRRELLFFLRKNYKDIELKKDVNRLIKFYQNNGFKDVIINTQVEYISDSNRFNLYFIINEGNKFEFSNFNINLDYNKFDESIKNQVLKLISEYNEFLNKKPTFNIDTVFKIKSELSDLLYNLGLNFFEININESISNSQVDILFIIEDLTPRYVNLINIKGNKLTQDYVIRRELELSEGDPINKKLINDSISNIRSLGFFTNVDIDEIETEDGVILNVKVDERSSGDFSIGVAFATIEGATFISKLNQKNIAGTGKSVDLAINTSSKNTQYKLSISQPRFFAKKIKLFYGLNYNYSDNSSTSSYNLENLIGDVGVEFNLSNKLKNSISLIYELNTYNVTDASSVSNNILDNEGTNAVIKLQNYLNYYNLNSFIRPQNGEQFILSSVLSPITNSTDGFIKNTLTLKKFYDYKRYIFSLQLKAANITSLQNDQIPDSEKYNMGGQWLRGFDTYGAGPRKSTTAYIGGNNLLISKFDISRSMFKNSNNPIDFFIFSDVGKVSGNKIKPTQSNESIRASAGYGVKLYTPIGPIGLSWGFPIMDESYDKKRDFLFSIGNLN